MPPSRKGTEQPRQQQSTAKTFLSLPAELRNAIYELVLVLPNQVISISGKNGKALPRNLPSTLGLLLVSRQIFSEASSMLFGENVWYAHNLEEVCEFLSGVERSCVGAIKKLEVKDLGVVLRGGVDVEFAGFVEEVKKRLKGLVESVEDGKGSEMRLDAVRIRAGCGVYRALCQFEGWDNIEGGWERFEEGFSPDF